MTLPKESMGLAEIPDDVVLPFSAEGLGTRGRLARLGPVVDQILRRHDYPEPVSRLLGEAIVLASMLGTTLKFDGRLILQTQSDGPVSTIVVDFDTPDSLRGWAQFDADAVARWQQSGSSDQAELLGKGSLALTLDYGREQTRYQGLVPLEGGSFAQAANLYFHQSEQIPTLVRLAVAENILPEGRQWRAGGLLVQYLPETGGIHRRPDLDPGDVPEGTDAPDINAEPEAWIEASALAATVEDIELIDPNLSPEQLLIRLYHESGVRVFESQPLSDTCRCSQDRIRDMLAQFSPEEREEMVENGGIFVTCEFCSTSYDFDPEEFKNNP